MGSRGLFRQAQQLLLPPSSPPVGPCAFFHLSHQLLGGGGYNGRVACSPHPRFPHYGGERSSGGGIGGRTGGWVARESTFGLSPAQVAGLEFRPCLGASQGSGWAGKVA